jgi:polar amino acid transport system ATP-binding protein
MDGGVVVEKGSPNEVFNNPQHDRTKSFLRRLRAESEEYVEALKAAAAAEGL